MLRDLNLRCTFFAQAQRTQLHRKISFADDRIETLRSDREQLLSSLTVTKSRLSELERSTRFLALEDGASVASDDVFGGAGGGRASSSKELWRLHSENSLLQERVGDLERRLLLTRQRIDDEVLPLARPPAPPSHPSLHPCMLINLQHLASSASTIVCPRHSVRNRHRTVQM